MSFEQVDHAPATAEATINAFTSAADAADAFAASSEVDPGSDSNAVQASVASRNMAGKAVSAMDPSTQG